MAATAKRTREDDPRGEGSGWANGGMNGVDSDEIDWRGGGEVDLAWFQVMQQKPGLLYCTLSSSADERRAIARVCEWFCEKNGKRGASRLRPVGDFSTPAVGQQCRPSQSACFIVASTIRGDGTLQGLSISPAFVYPYSM